jgi:hypothetical protein
MSRPFFSFLPLFTQVRGIGILRRSQNFVMANFAEIRAVEANAAILRP